jgi:hypothetical protein
MSQALTDITIEDDAGDTAARWIDPDVRLREAAPDLFAALTQALAALNTAPRFTLPVWCSAPSPCCTRLLPTEASQKRQSDRQKRNCRALRNICHSHLAGGTSIAKRRIMVIIS